MTDARPSVLFPDGVRAVNVGLDLFADPLPPTARRSSASTGGRRPRAIGTLGLLLARLEDDPDDPVGARVAAANATAVERLLAAQPMLVDVQPAPRGDPGLGPAQLLHCRAADRLGADVRAGRGRGHRRRPVRGLGVDAGGGDGAAASGRHRVRRRATTTARSARWPA